MDEQFPLLFFKGDLVMSTYARIKQTVTTRQAAERYGLSVNQSGMTRCPFHEDHNPSMKVDDRFYCFGCGASGDVIDFTARLFGISLKDATEKLAADFGISADAKPVAVRRNPFRLEELRCRRVLTDYLHLLKEWKTCYAPKTPEDSLDDRFVESCQQYDRIAGLLEMLDEAIPTEHRHAVSALIADGSIAFWERIVTENQKEERHRVYEPEIT